MSILGELVAVELERAVAALRTLWNRLKRMPPRRAFDPEVLKPWLPNIVIAEAVGAPPRFRVRLAGTAAVGFAGRDFTDKFLDAVIPPEHYQAAIAPYVRAMASGQPTEDDILREQFIAPDGASLPVRRLVTPCSSDGHAANRFVVGLFLHRPQSSRGWRALRLSHGMVKALDRMPALRVSPHPMLALAPRPVNRGTSSK